MLSHSQEEVVRYGRRGSSLGVHDWKDIFQQRKNRRDVVMVLKLLIEFNFQ